MELKKYPEISLEKKKGLFFQIGLIVTLIILLGAFEWKSYDKVNYNLGQLNLANIELLIKQVLLQKNLIKPLYLS